MVNTSFKAGEDSSNRPDINANLTVHNKIRNANIDVGQENMPFEKTRVVKCLFSVGLDSLGRTLWYSFKAYI